MPPHPSTNFEIEKYYQNKPKFNSLCSRKDSPKIKVDELKSIETHWIALYLNRNNTITLITLELNIFQKK